MSDTTVLYRRLRRREMHSPKSVLAITLAVLVILTCIWLGVELVLSLLGQPALLVAPTDMLASPAVLETVLPGILAGIGIAVALVGVLLILAALTAGRRARHILDTERAVTVVDNDVIASALARHAARAGNTDPDNARVTVSHRTAEVHLTPPSGSRIDRDLVAVAIDEQLAAYGLRPAVKSKILLSSTGKVGA